MVPVLTALLVIGSPLACTALVRSARRADSGARAQLLVARARWQLPSRLRAPLARALRDADVHVEPEGAFGMWVGGVVAAGMVALSLSPGMVIPACLAGALAGPVALRLGRLRREQRFASALPAALEHVAAELRGGGTVMGAVDRLAATDGPVAEDLRRVHVRTLLGLGLRDALEGWPADHDTPGVRAAAGALAVASTLGGRAADAIDGLASSLRHRLDASAEGRALSAQSRLSAVVVGVAPIGYLAFSSLVDPGSVTVLVGTDVGRVCLILGLGLEAVAALWIRRIVRSEE